MKRTVFATLFALALALSPSATAASPLPEVQPTIEDAVRNLDLHDVMNARDLGGLRGSRGFIPHNRFYRSATLVDASLEDRKVLLSRNITLDIDLRTSAETSIKGDRLSHDGRFGYEHISLLGVGIADWFRSLPAIYVHALDTHQSSFRDVFHAIAAHENGAVLYHCTSGKDRTGMVSAILLDLAGVSREDIVRDYAISAHYLGRGMSASPPAIITAFLDRLQSKYGGARAFLTHAGVSESDIHALLVKLGQA